MKNPLIRCRLVLTMALLSVYSSSHAENLLDIYHTALNTDLEYLNAIEINFAAQEELSIARSSHIPTISLDGNKSKTDSGSETDSESSSYGATFSVPIYNYSNFVNSDLADSSSLQAKVTLKIAEQNLIIKVARRYFDVLAAEDGLVFARAEKRAIARQLDQTKQRFEVGLVAITDVHEAQARYDFSVAQGIGSENKLDNAKESLREVTGLYHKELSHLAKNTPLSEPKPADIDSWTDRALKQSLSLISSAEGITVAKENINLAQAGYHPSVNFNVKYNYNPDPKDIITLDSNDNIVSVEPGIEGSTTSTLNLSYTLFSGGSTRAKVRQARHKLTQAKHYHEQVRRAVQRNTRDAYLDVIAGISRVKALEQAVVSRKSAQRASEAGFEVGTKTTVDVLNSRRELFSAQNAFSQARYNFLIDTLKLKQAVAELTEKDLDKISSWME